MLAELDAKQERLMREAKEAEEIVRKAEEEKKMAEIEAKEAQETLKAKSDFIDQQAEIVRDEVIEHKITNEQMENDFVASMAAKAEREEQEYIEWERQNFAKNYGTKIDDIKMKAQEEFKRGSYSEAITLYK